MGARMNLADLGADARPAASTCCSSASMNTLTRMPRVGKPFHDPAERRSQAGHVEAAFGRDLLARPSGTSIAISGFDRAGDRRSSRPVSRHLRLSLMWHELARPRTSSVLDVATILAQVDGDAVGSAQVRLDGRPNRVGLVGAPRLPQRERRGRC